MVFSDNSVWKGKVRKLFAKGKFSDEGKVRALVLEGNNLPFTSRLKVTLGNVLQSLGHGLSSGAASSTLVISMFKKYNETKNSTQQFEVCYSSDDEDDFDITKLNARKADDAIAASLSVQTHRYYRYSYPEDFETRLARYPSLPWPPQLR